MQSAAPSAPRFIEYAICSHASLDSRSPQSIAREYEFNAYAVDLWSDPEENRAFFDSLGISRDTIHPVQAGALEYLNTIAIVLRKL